MLSDTVSFWHKSTKSCFVPTVLYIAEFNPVSFVHCPFNTYSFLNKQDHRWDICALEHTSDGLR